MLQKVLVAAAVVAVSSPMAGAQTQVAASVPSSTLQQVSVFEAALRSAVEKATGSVGERAREIVPDIAMRYQFGLEIRGIILPTDGSYVFYVDPPIIESTVLLLAEVNQRFPRGPMRNASASAGPPAAETAAPTAAPAPVNLAAEYSGFLHAGIVSAMLDNALSLPIADAQTLTVIVTTGSAPQMNPMAPRDRKLHLTLKGEDLLALRQNRITRDQARARIIEKRY